MKTVSVLRRHYLDLFLAIHLFIGFTRVVALANDTNTEGSQAPLPLGRVTVLGEVKCPQDATTGATCTSISVSCPGLADLTGTLSETSPMGTARGTVVLANGGGGTTFFNAGFASAYINAGFRVAQFLWTNDWEDTGGVGLKSAACRSATIFRYFFYTFHHADLTTGFVLRVRAEEGERLATRSRSTAWRTISTTCCSAAVRAFLAWTTVATPHSIPAEL